MDEHGHTGAEGTKLDAGEHDYVAEAQSALADVFREAPTLFEVAAIHSPHLAAFQAQRLRQALIVVMLVLGEARRARRRASG